MLLLFYASKYSTNLQSQNLWGCVKKICCQFSALVHSTTKSAMDCPGFGKEAEGAGQAKGNYDIGLDN